jgi:ribosomal subunit interface protein
LHGAVLCAKESDSDLYAAIDLAFDKLERQVRKQKDKIKLQRRRMSA